MASAPDWGAIVDFLPPTTCHLRVVSVQCGLEERLLSPANTIENLHRQAEERGGCCDLSTICSHTG